MSIKVFETKAVAKSKKQTAIKNAFIRFLAEQNSDNTRAAYKNSIRDFYTFKRLNDVAGAINRARVTEFRDHLINSGYSASTVHQKIAAISSLFNFLIAENVITKNPALSLKLPLVSAKENEVAALTKEECILLFDSAPRTKPNELMFYTAMRLQYQIGCRAVELSKMKPDDLRKQKNGTCTISFVQKGSRFRIVTIPVKLFNEIKSFIKKWEQMTGLILDGDDYLFQTKTYRMESKQTKPFRRASYDTYLKNSAELAGLGNLSSHVAKATVMTLLCDQGLSTRDIAKIMGCREENVEKYNRGNKVKQADAISNLF